VGVRIANSDGDVRPDQDSKGKKPKKQDRGDDSAPNADKFAESERESKDTRQRQKHRG
jgi:hypothetical protein